jgi:glyoxylase-like metal-dependent hydrolase (beta-lactamase superfamily II)/rhodanese-related sulfurtransferase
MLFRQLFDHETSTYTYLLADPETRDAVIIDPVREQLERDLSVIADLSLQLRYVLDTHVHADHVTGSGLLRERTGAKTVVSKHGGAPCADVLVDDGDVIQFGKHQLEVRATPGHTAGCVTYVTAERDMAFTGDTLLIRGCGRTDFQQGDARQLYQSVVDKIFSLPDDTKIFPGHDYKGRTMSTVIEEKSHNPRLKEGTSENEFAVIMSGLKLAYPKRIQEAVPANQKCGITDGKPHDIVTHESWAPVVRTPTGIPEVTPAWVASSMDRGLYRIVDVREPEEVKEGMVPGAVNFPLAVVGREMMSLDRDTPVVVICRSGGRSGRAALELLAHGFTRVASMTGGMLTWRGPTRMAA